MFAGFPGCEKVSQCTEVPKGQRVVITKEGKQAPAIPFNAAEAMGFKSSGNGQKHSIDPENSRIDLFLEAKMLDQKYEQLELKDISKMLGDAQSAMQKAQNDMLDRTEELRQAMNKSIDDGTYLEKKALGEAALAKAGVDTSENKTSGLLNAKKFSAGKTVLERLKLPPGRIQKAGDLTNFLTGKKSISNSGGTGGFERDAKSALDAATAFMNGLKPPELPSSQNIKAILQDAVLKETTETTKGFVQVYKKCHSPHIYHSHCDSNWISQEMNKTVKIGNEYYMVNQFDKVSTKKDTTEKVERKNGECFRTVTVCEDKLKPCDTSNGAFCKPEIIKACSKTVTGEKIPCP